MKVMMLLQVASQVTSDLTRINFPETKSIATIIRKTYGHKIPNDVRKFEQSKNGI